MDLLSILASSAVSTALAGTFVLITKTVLTRAVKHEYDQRLLGIKQGYDEKSLAIKNEYDRQLAALEHNSGRDLLLYKEQLSLQNTGQLNAIRVRVEAEYEIAKAGMLRYSEKQFDLYNEVWSALCDLRASVDTLWEKATSENVQKLAEQIQETRAKIRRTALLIENQHYRELNMILDEFDGYRFGKGLLLDLRGGTPAPDDESFIRSLIEVNQESKQRLELVLDQIMACLRRQVVERYQIDFALSDDVVDETERSDAMRVPATRGE